MNAVRSTVRNRLAHRLASTALLIADRPYRTALAGAWQYGLASAARDALVVAPAPDRLEELIRDPEGYRQRAVAAAREVARREVDRRVQLKQQEKRR